MDDQYGLPSDLRHLSASSIFPVLGHRNATSSSHLAPASNNSYQAVQPLISPPPSNRAVTFPLVSGGALVDHHHHHYSSLYRGVHDQLESGGGAWNVESLVMNSGCGGGGGEASNNNSRWPRQETLTLLEIRSRLNSKFKDTNQKAPLWDEISRIMAEEHGYQRSGKKCKEKFENLYKYYKKTKEGKAGRQDGKHYRFFRQLEAIYGDQSSNQSSSLLDTQFIGRNSSLLYDHQGNTPTMNRPTNINHESLSFSINSTEFETSSSENNEDDLSAIAFKMNNSNRTASRLMDDQKMKGVASRLPSHGNKGSSSSWKAKVEGFVDSQMKKIMETQETWMEKMLKSVIGKEEERLAKENEWRKQEAARFDQEVTEFWAKERAWVEARDAALTGALKNLRAKESSLELPSFPERMIGTSRDHTHNVDARSTYGTSYQRWSEEEISSLIELRIGLGTALSEDIVYDVNNKDGVWEEIASKMRCLGYCRTANECREKWESVSLYVTMTSECKKKRREDYYKTSGYYFDNQPLMDLKQESNEVRTNAMGGLQLMDEGLNSSSCSNVGTSQMNPNNFFHLLFGEGENLWEKYGTLKLGKDKTNQH